MFCYNKLMEEIPKLIQAAHDVVTVHSDGKNHTVAAAVLAANGSIVTGVNLSHFTGGPCAELVALANAAAAGKTNLKSIVAVGDRNRGVLAPCGRCRQVMADNYPELAAIIMEADLPVAKTTQELLPFTYDWGANQIGE